MRINCPVSASEKFSGLLRNYKNTGKPRVELIASSQQSNAGTVILYGDGQRHWCSELYEGLNAYFIVMIYDGIF